MLLNSSAYFVLWILHLLFVKNNCQRSDLHQINSTATLIDSKLYFVYVVSTNDSSGSPSNGDGGAGMKVHGDPAGPATGVYPREVDIKGNFTYLDVSIRFNTQNLSWHD